MTNTKYIMKQYIATALFLSLFMFSCQPTGDETKDLETLKKELSEKKKEKRTLETTITELEEKISELEPEKEKTRKAVTTYSLKAEEYKSYVELQGNLQSSDGKMVSSETGGRLTSITIDEGDYVKRGQMIGTVDMESVKKSIQEIETSLSLATTVYERQKKLWDQQIGSEIQYLQAKNNKERLENSLETIKVQLSKQNIVSPMNGYVDKMFLKSGEMASPGMPIASIINTSTVKAVVDVPENLLASVKRGDKVSVSFPALGLERNAKISMIGRSIDPANRTFKAEVNLSNPGGKLKPNLLTLTKINDKTIKDALLLPVELVQQDVSGKSFVYVVAEGEDGPYAQKNIVTTGDSFDGKIIIETGLTAGDQIIQNGARGLANEDLIQIENAAE